LPATSRLGEGREGNPESHQHNGCGKGRAEPTDPAVLPDTTHSYQNRLNDQ
jgi:hypothetical protein